MISGDEDEAVVIAGGFDGQEILKSVEVYSPDGRCNIELPMLPNPVYSGGIFQMNNTLVACGGSQRNGKKCYYFDRFQRKWVTDGVLTLSQPRYMSGFTVSNDGIVFVR